MGRKHCGKRRNCLLQAICPFPTEFSKGFQGVKDHFCEVSLTSDCQFQRRFYSYCLQTDRLTDRQQTLSDYNSSPRPWKCSGELKRGLILAKLNLELSPLFVHIPLLIVNTHFQFQVYMFSNGTDMTKCHSFCTIETTARATTEHDHTPHQCIVKEQILVTEWRMV